MWRWRYFKFPPLLKGVRTGNKNKLYSLLEQGEQDTLKQHEVQLATNGFDKVKNYLQEALKLEPACYNYVNNMLMMTEGRVRAMLEDAALDHDSGPAPKTPKSPKTFTSEESVNTIAGSSADSASKHEPNDTTTSSGGALDVRASIDSSLGTFSSKIHGDNRVSVSLEVKFVPSQVVSEEIILVIFGYLTVSELGRAGSVCKVWWRLASDYSLWKAQYIKNVFVDPEYGDVDYRNMCKDINLVRRHWRIGECIETPLHTFEDLVLSLHFDENNVWDFKASKVVKTIEDHDSPVRSLQFNSALLATGSANVVNIWDTTDYKLIQTLSNFEGEPVSLSMFRHLLATAVRDCVLLWNLEGIGNDSFLDATNEIPGHNGNVNCVQFNDMHSLLSAGEDRTIKLWDIHSNRVIHTMTGHRSAIQSFYSDGEFIVSGGADGSLRFHDMRSKRCLETVQATQGAITCVQFNDFQILTGHITGAITHWDVRCSKWDQELLLAHTGAVSCLGFDRTRIISGSLDCSVRLWDFSSGFRQAHRGGDETTRVHFSHFKATKNNTSKYCNII